MNRRTLFRLVLGAATAGLARPWWTADDFGPHTALPAPEGLAFDPEAFTKAMEPLRPFATFPATIEVMETIKSNGGDEHLFVLAGGIAYTVNRHGTVTRL